MMRNFCQNSSVGSLLVAEGLEEAVMLAKQNALLREDRPKMCHRVRMVRSLVDWHGLSWRRYIRILSAHAFMLLASHDDYSDNCVTSSRFFKIKRTAPQHNQTKATEEPALQMPSIERQEDLHYEDVNFIKKPSCVSESGSRKQQETLYAQ
ncbi:hypothetical protein XENORESO_014489, partial [Xenotaenia resolanae]